MLKDLENIDNVILKVRVDNLCRVSIILNDECMLETGSYYVGGTMQDSDLEEVMMYLDLHYVCGDYEPKQKAKGLELVEEDIKYSKIFDAENEKSICVPYCDIKNRFNEDSEDERIFFFGKASVIEGVVENE